MPSLKIEKLSWGKITTSDGKNFKDLKIYPGVSMDWDWSETGTHHSPGIQIEDLSEMIEAGVEKIVLSSGYMKRLKVESKTLTYLEENGIEFFILITPKAVKKYNELKDKFKTGALIHSTC